MADIKDLSAKLQSLKKQIPFATAQALTSVARQIASAEKTAFQRKLENPTPFTVNSVGSVGARRDNLIAKVFVRDIAAGYLEPFEFGGVHKLNGNALLNPKNIKLNKYGNIPRNKIAQIKATGKAFFGKVDGRSGLWQRHKYKKVKRRAKRSANGTRRDKVKQPPLVLRMQFGDALPVKPTLGYMDRAEKMTAGLMPGALIKAISEALKTAK